MDQETAVIIEKDIGELNYLHKFDQCINVSVDYHLNRCEKGQGCSNCKLLLNLRFIYVENLIDGDGVEIFTKLLLTTLRKFFFFEEIFKVASSS